MDLGLKHYLMEEFEEVKYPDIYSYVASLDSGIKNLALTELLQERQRLKRETPYQVISMIEEKKKELEKKFSGASK